MYKETDEAITNIGQISPDAAIGSAVIKITLCCQRFHCMVGAGVAQITPRACDKAVHLPN